MATTRFEREGDVVVTRESGQFGVFWHVYNNSMVVFL